MFRIRYYSQVFHPDYFQGRGLLGVAIRGLNFIRWKLEQTVEYLVLRDLARRENLPKSEVKRLIESFRMDLRYENFEKSRSSPKFLTAQTGPVVDHLVRRSEMSQSGELPDHPGSVVPLIERYGRPDMRAQRYARGHRYNPGDPEGDFEPVVNDKKAKDDDGGRKSR